MFSLFRFRKFKQCLNSGNSERPSIFTLNIIGLRQLRRILSKWAIGLVFVFIVFFPRFVESSEHMFIMDALSKDVDCGLVFWKGGTQNINISITPVYFQAVQFFYESIGKKEASIGKILEFQQFDSVLMGSLNSLTGSFLAKDAPKPDTEECSCYCNKRCNNSNIHNEPSNIEIIIAQIIGILVGPIVGGLILIYTQQLIYPPSFFRLFVINLHHSFQNEKIINIIKSI
jgi:hypothetical protein